MIGQKEFVIQEVMRIKPSFVLGQTVAIQALSTCELELLKTSVSNAIAAGIVSYGKDRGIAAQVVPYARSMVMNHLKKAKELNGGGSGVPAAKVSAESNQSGINKDLLTPQLRAFVEENLE